MLKHIAIVSQSPSVKLLDVNRVSAALQKQVSRDFGPIWHVQATVDAFDKLEHVPIGYWPIIIQDNIHEAGALGVHLDRNRQPFALVQVTESWTLTTSHECLEMLADPFGNRLIAGQSAKPDQGRVQYLVEVCDPSEDADFAYNVNGVLVSDFYTPHFFDPIEAQGVRYSFTGSITQPHQVLEGGYLSWHEPITDSWWQLFVSGGQENFKNLGVLGRITESLRSTINGMTPVPEFDRGFDKKHKSLVAARAAQKAADESMVAKARAWQEQIEELTQAKS